MKYATQKLGYPVWGMSPSSTADDTGDYGGFGAEGLAFGSSWAARVVHDVRHREHRQSARLGDRATGAGVRGALEPREAAEPATRGSTPPTAGSTTRSTRSPVRSDTGGWCSTSR